MYLISHIATFYIFGKSIKMKKLWIGMLSSIIPDIVIFLFLIGQSIGMNIPNGSSHPLNIFLHSIFPLIFLTPLLIFERWYFYSATIGYSFHLLLDYFTHTTIRMPFFPLSHWKVPIFLISYQNVTLLFLINVIICMLFLIIYGKKIIELFKELFNKYQKERVSLFMVIYFVFTLIFGILYSFTVIKSEHLLSLLLTPFIIINLFFLGLLFVIEIYNDKRIAKHLKTLVDTLLRSTSVPSQ